MACVREVLCIGEMVAGSRVVVSRWLFGGVLFAFVLPFVTVSCMGEPVASVSGTTLVAGGTLTPAGELARELAEQPGQAVGGDEFDEEVAAEPWAGVAAAAMLVGLVVAFTSLATPVTLAVIAAAGAGSLLLLRVSITDSLVGEGPFEVSFSSGWWLALAGCLAVVVVNATGLFGSRAPPRASAEPTAAQRPSQRAAPPRSVGRREPPSTAASSPPSPVPGKADGQAAAADAAAAAPDLARFCERCGTEHSAAARFCGSCGTARTGSVGHGRQESGQ